MATNKAIFYFNIINEKNVIYIDLNERLTGWDRKIREFLGPDYDLLVVPVVRRETGLEFVPQLPPKERHVSSMSVLTEEQIAAGPSKKTTKESANT